MKGITVAAAAKALGISEDGIRKRIKRGELSGERIPRAQGFTWRVHLDNQDVHLDNQPESNLGEVQALRDTIEILKGELEHKNHQLGLTLLELAEMRKLALPAPKSNWFRRILHRTGPKINLTTH